MSKVVSGKAWVLMAFALVIVGACTKKQTHQMIQNKGSDTMVNLAQAWAEEYRKVKPEVAIAVTGGGSGTGIAALMNGTVDIANASRAVEPEEAEVAKKNTGKEVEGSVVALDALAVFTHPDNPIKEISIEQLACIYGEKGTCETWDSVGITKKICEGNKIVRVSRQSNSGTYMYFQEAILGKKGDFRMGSIDLHGSKDVVDLVEKTPCAIGYSGMGYLTEKVTALCVKAKGKENCVKPSEEAVVANTYPIARELYMYTLGTPQGDIKTYLEWLHTPEAQKIVRDMGYVPFKKGAAAPAEQGIGR